MATVMIVDDDQMNRELLETVMKRAGYIVIAHNSGEAALEHLPTAAVDIVLCDVRMNGIDGFETCAAIKADAATASIPVIIFSALDDTAERLRAQQVGASAYVNKMQGWQALVEQVRAFIA